MDKIPKSSHTSLADASRDVSEFSGHGKALGAAGYRVSSEHPENCEFLEHPGQSIAISPHKEGFESVLIGVAWDGRVEKVKSPLGKLMKRTRKIDVDLDIGCLYELKDGTRGAIQAFGEKFGHYDKPPFIVLSDDERTGATPGHDEFILINAHHWDKIKRVIVYIYIYAGAPSWSHVKPQIVVDIPGENDFYVTLDAFEDHLCLCALAELENVRGGIRLTNRTEYFPGHEEMDRAFGFGLLWSDGMKGPPASG